MQNGAIRGRPPRLRDLGKVRFGSTLKGDLSTRSRLYADSSPHSARNRRVAGGWVRSVPAGESAVVRPYDHGGGCLPLLSGLCLPAVPPHPGAGRRRHPQASDLSTHRGENRLKIKRAERDWSQADLARRLEVSRQTINAIETGKYDPSLPLAFKIAALFETSIKAVFLPDQLGEDS